jgi:hypothetical protein
MAISMAGSSPRARCTAPPPASTDGAVIREEFPESFVVLRIATK